MTSKTTIAMTLAAVLSAPAVHAEWRGNQPCSGKEGIIGSCLNRNSAHERDSATRAKEERSVYIPAAAPTGTPTQAPRTASTMR